MFPKAVRFPQTCISTVHIKNIKCLDVYGKDLDGFMRPILETINEWLMDLFLYELAVITSRMNHFLITEIERLHVLGLFPDKAITRC